jgi:hypothetical protein
MSKWEERCPEFEISVLNSPPTVDCEVDFAVKLVAVKETAEQKARRRWRMEEPEKVFGNEGFAIVTVSEIEDRLD